MTFETSFAKYIKEWINVNPSLPLCARYIWFALSDPLFTLLCAQGIIPCELHQWTPMPSGSSSWVPPGEPRRGSECKKRLRSTYWGGLLYPTLLGSLISCPFQLRSSNSLLLLASGSCTVHPHGSNTSCTHLCNDLCVNKPFSKYPNLSVQSVSCWNPNSCTRWSWYKIIPSQMPVQQDHCKIGVGMH